MDGEYDQKIIIRISSEQKREIVEAARYDRINISSFARKALADAVRDVEKRRG